MQHLQISETPLEIQDQLLRQYVMGMVMATLLGIQITTLNHYFTLGTSSAVTGYLPLQSEFCTFGDQLSRYNKLPSLQLSQFSVAAWFKTSTNFGTDAFIVNKGGAGSDSSGQNLNYGIWMTSTEKVKAGFETSTGADQYITSPLSYNDGKWHYAVVTFGGTTIVLYVDGVQVGTKSTLGASPESSGTKPVRIGS